MKNLIFALTLITTIISADAFAGGDCHVGIAVGNGQSFDNDGLWGKPSISRIGYRMRWRFMYAKRMR